MLCYVLTLVIWAHLYLHSVPSLLRLWYYYDTGTMGFKQDSSHARNYLEQLKELLSESDIQEMKLVLINDLKLLGSKLS